jgi:hypothetical protein
LAALPVYAWNTFERTYGGVEFDYGRSVQQTSDGGYIVTGETHSFGVGWGDVYLLRVDSLGDTVWSRTYGGALYDCGRCVQETPEGGFIIAGETQSFGAGGNDVYLVMTDSMGNALWTRTYGGGDYECGYSVKETIDGDYVIAGETGSFGAGGRDIYFIKTDFMGNVILDTTYGGSGSERGFGIEETSDGGYVITGHTSSFGAGSDDVYVVKTDDSGSVAWTQTYGTTSTEWGRAVEENPDGGYTIIGETRSSGVFDFYLVTTDSAGNTLWDTTYGGSSHDRCMSGARTLDGGFILVGYTLSFGAGDYDVYIIRADSIGDTVWTKTYGGSDEDRGAFVQQTADSGFVVAGYTESFGAGGYDAYLIKVGPDGVVATYDAAVLTIDAPGDTVLRDSIYSVVATVRNLGNVTASFDVVAAIDGYTDTVQVTDLASDSSLQVSFAAWQVPPVDSMTFTMDVCAYVHNDEDSTNDCVQNLVYAFDPTRVYEGAGFGARKAFFLGQNKPNPFGGSTTISYSMPAGSRVSLRVYDVAGRLVTVLVDDWRSAGLHHSQWEASDSPAGLYFCRLQAGPLTATKALLHLK